MAINIKSLQNKIMSLKNGLKRMNKSIKNFMICFVLFKMKKENSI